MSKYGGNNRIDFGVHFNTDKSSLEDVKKSLQALQNIKLADFKGSREELIAIKTEALKVQAALTSAFNVKIGSLNIEKFKKELDGLNIDKLYTDFSKLGSAGQVAFSKMATSMMTTNLQLKETHSLINSMGTTMMNTVKWGIASSVMNNFTQSVSEAFQYVKSLDSALTDIRIVTGDSTEKMAQFADQANRAAQSLGRSTMDYSKAALTFYQQGLSDEDVAARTEATLKAQNITGAGQEMADYLTAVWNGYKVANEEAELYVDKLAAVADSSASNMSQLAVAMSKVAATANMLGVPVDSLNAQIATIEATTRQAPETVGNALKTIYARINDIKTGSDDAEVSLGNYTEQMAKLGVNVLDASGNLRDTGDVIEEIGGKWETLSREQQIYLARTMAGQRQYNNLLALFENWGKYTDLVNVSMEAQGTTMEKNSRYMDSLAAHMEQLGAAGERVKTAMIDSDSFKGLIDIGTGLTNLFANLIESIGGGGTAFLALGGIVTQVFSGVISREIANVINNFKIADENAQALARDIELTKEFGKSQAYTDGVIDSMVKAKEAGQQYYNTMSEGQINTYNGIVQQIGAAEAQIASIKQETDEANKLNKAFSDVFGENTGAQLLILQDDFKELDKDVANFYKSLNSGAEQSEITDIYNNLKKQLDNLSESLGSFEIPGLDKIREKLETIDPTTQKGAAQVRQLRIEINNLINESNRQLGLINQVDDLNNKTKQYQATLNQAKNTQKDFLNNIETEAHVKQFTNMVSAVGRLASGIMAVTNLTKVWHNDSLSAGQKILQTITSISFIIPMFVTSLRTIQKSLGMETTLLDSILIKEKLHTKELEKQALLKQSSNGMYSGLSGEARKLYQQNKTDIEALQKAQESFKEGAKSAGSSALSFLKTVGPYAIILGAAAGALYAMYKAYNSAADAAKKANQIAAESTEHYKAIQSTVQQTSDSIKKYNELQNNFKNLTAGTQEWNSALKQSNDIVIDLIRKFPELVSQVKNVHGQLIIDPKALEEAQKKLEHITNTMAVSNSEMQHQARQATIRSDATNLGRQFSREGGDVSSEGNQGISASGRFRNATENGQLNQTEILKVAQYFGNFEKGLIQNVNNLDELSNKISDETGIEQQLIQTLFNNEQATQGLRDIVAQTDADLQATNLEYQNRAANSKELTESEAYKGASDLDKQIMQNLGGKALQQAEKEQIEIVNKTIDGLTKVSSVNNKNYQELLSQLQQVGLNAKASTSGNPVTGTDGNRVVAFNIDGEEVKYRKEELASIIAASQALKTLGNSAETTRQMLSGLSAVGDKNAEGIRQLLAGNGFSGMSKGEVEGLNADTSAMAEYFEKNFKAAGYDSAKEFKEAFIDEQKTTIAAFNQILEGGSTAVKEAFNSLDTQSLSLDAQKGIVESLQKAFNEGGKVASDQLTSFYSKISDLDAFSEITEGLDFTTITASDLKEKLEEAGIATNLTTEELNAYIEAQKGAAEATSPEETYKNVHDVIEGLKRGDTIDEQQQKKLTDAGIELDNFFSKMPDGTMKLKASAEEFYNYANNISLEGFKTQIEALQNRIGEQQNFEESKYSASNNKNNLESAFQDFSSNAWGDTDKLNAQIQLLNTIPGLEDDMKQRLQEINAGQQITAQDTKKIAEAVEMHKGAWENNKEAIKQNQEQIQNLNEEIANAKPIDIDVDEEKMLALADFLKDMAKSGDEDNLGALEISQTLAEDQQAAEDLAEALLRYDHALEQVAEHYDDWMAGLSSGNWQEQAQIGNQLKNVYSDMLDLPFETLSSNFTTSTQNLQLLQQAANGSEEAYRQLQEIARQDIATHVGFDDSEFQAGFNNLLNQYYHIQSLDDLEVGAELNDQNFLNELANMVNAANMTAQQATDYLASMGIDAQITENKATSEDEETVQGFTPKFRPHTADYTWASVNSNGDLETHTEKVSIPELYYEQGDPIKISNTKETTGHALKVTSARKSSGGGFKFKQTAHGGGNKGSRGSKGGGGKKGGGGSSAKPSIAKTNTTKIDTKKKTQENDPYYKINNSIEKQSKLLDDIKDQEKQLVNKDRLKNLQSQNKEIEKQLGNYQEYLSISKNVAAENSTANLRKRLQDTFGSNIGFDTEGNIADMNKVQRAAVDSYNKAATQAENTFKKVQDQYNNWILHTWNTYSKDQQEAHQKDKEAWDEKIKNAETAAKDAISAAEEEYKKKTDLIKKYQDQLKRDKEMHEKYIESLRTIIENNIEASKIKVDLALDTGQLERDWLEFENKFIKKLDDKDILGQAAANAKELMSYFDSEEIAKTNKQIEDLYKDLNNIQNGGFSNIYGVDEEYYNGLTEAEKESLRTWGEGQLQKRLQELQEQQQESLMKMQDIINDIKDQYLDMIDEAKDQMDDHIDQYERVNNIIEHNVKLTEMLYGDKGYQTLDKYYQMQKDNNMSTLQTLKAQEAYWREQMNHEVVGSEAWKKFKENLDNAIDAVNSKLEDMLDNLAKEFENKMNAAVDRINNRLTSGLGTNYLDEQWDYLNNYDDYFLDTYNATTGIEDVTRAYQQAIDDAAANPKQQQKLNKLMNDQLKILKEKDKLTEYDLERAKSMLEVEKARMALEDARNSKTKMRLRRDSQGNYTYQYVADEQKLGELQQALTDAQNDLYNTDKEHYKENLNTLYDTYKEYIEKMKDLTAEYNATQDEEERKRIQNRMDLLKESYSKMYEGLTEDNKYNIQYLAESFSTGMNLDFSGLTTEEQWEVLKENVPWAQSNIQALADSIVAEGGLLPATKDLVKELGDAIVQYDTDVQHILETGGTSLATISGVLDENGMPLDQNITDAQKMIEYNNQLVNATMQGVEEMQTLLSTVDDYWSKQMENIQKYVTTLQNSYDTLQKLNDSTLTSDKIDVVDTQTSSTTDAVSDLAFTGDLKSDTNMLQEKLNSLMLEYKEFLASMGAAVFDTGGYTGIWGGDDGKIALLHQKELVLNPTDTENILAAVTAVRDATANMNITSQLDNLGNSTSNLLRNLLENSTLLDQNVHIDANFPNVNNHTQIEEAFNNLVNMAAMRASGYRD